MTDDYRFADSPQEARDIVHAVRSAAQRGRQETRERTGRYKNMPPCQGGCGTRINVGAGKYFSHPLSDTVDRNGVNWGDRALLLCQNCATQCSACLTVREFELFVKAKRAVVRVSRS